MSRKLDALIAERVMGARVVYKSAGSNTYLPHSVWNDGGADTVTPLAYYSTDIAAAWQVVEALANRGIHVGSLYRLTDRVWACTFHNRAHDKDDEWTGISIKPPVAICKAALLSVGVSQAEIDAALSE
jgi:hypothetical protein